MEQFTHQVGHHPVILPQHPLPYPSTQFYPFKSMFSTFESNSVWCHALPRKWNLNETHAEATGARTVMYSAPQYRFFLFSNQMIMNWKKSRGAGVPSKPGEKKDDKYWERRRWEDWCADAGFWVVFWWSADLDRVCRKNNLAAKKSRDARRVRFTPPHICHFWL